MNYEQAMAIFRTVLQVGGAVLATKGLVTPNEVAGLTEGLSVGGGALISIGSLIWGIWARNDHNLVKSAAEVVERKPDAAGPLAPAAERIVRNNRYS